jgi:hypothetical protein
MLIATEEYEMSVPGRKSSGAWIITALVMMSPAVPESGSHTQDIDSVAYVGCAGKRS